MFVKKFLSLCLVLCAMAVFGSCHDGDKPRNVTPVDPTLFSETVSANANETEELVVATTKQELAGTTIRIPAGTLTENTTFAVSVSSTSATDLTNSGVSRIIKITANKPLNGPVTLRVPVTLLDSQSIDDVEIWKLSEGQTIPQLQVVTARNADPAWVEVQQTSFSEFWGALPAKGVWRSGLTTFGSLRGSYGHAAVWTGDNTNSQVANRMIVWGGKGSGKSTGGFFIEDTSNGGYFYDPGTGVHVSTPADNQPSLRVSHSAVWTGESATAQLDSRMIVWGGSGGTLGSNPFGDGKILNAKTGTWSDIASANAPSARHSHSAHFIDGKMYIWGGTGKTDGGIYDPVTNSWTAMPPLTKDVSTLLGYPDSTHNAHFVNGQLWVFHQDNTISIYDPSQNTWSIDTTGWIPSQLLHTPVFGNTTTKITYTEYLSNISAITENTQKLFYAAGAYPLNLPNVGRHTVWTGDKLLFFNPHPIAFDPVSRAFEAYAAKPALINSYRESMGVPFNSSHIWNGSEIISWGGNTRRISSQESTEVSDIFILDPNGYSVPAQPQITSATPTRSGVTVTWNAIEGARKYKVYYSTNPNMNAATAQFMEVTSTTGTVDNLPKGSSYYFRVAALSQYESAVSDRVQSGPVFDAPSLTATAGRGQVALQWEEVTNISGYQLRYRQTGASTDIETLTIPSGQSSRTITGLANDAAYTFFLTATDTASGRVSAEASASATPSFPGPANFAAEFGYKEIRLSWTSDTTVDNYRLSWFTNGDDTNLQSFTITPNTTSSHTLTVVNDIPYTIFLTSSLSGSTSAETQRITGTPQLNAPGDLVVMPTSSTLSFGWMAVEGAASYEITYFPVGNPTATTTTSVPGANGTMFALQGLTNGVAYTVVVTAIGQDGERKSTTESDYTPNIPAPEGLTATGVEDAIHVSWDPEFGVDGYRVYYSDEASNPTKAFVEVAGESSTSTTLEFVTHGLRYDKDTTISVAAYIGVGIGLRSATIAGKPLLPSVRDIVATPGNGSASISWTEVSGYGYSLLVFPTGESIPVAAVDPATSPTVIDNLTNGQEYDVLVVSFFIGQPAAPNVPTSLPKFTPILPAPTNVVASGSGLATVTVTWDPVDNATGYELYFNYEAPLDKQTAVRASQAFGGVPVTSPYVVNTFSNAPTYVALVALGDNDVESVLSTTASATAVFPAPTDLQVTGGAGEATLTWTNVLGAAEHRVYWSTTPNFDLGTIPQNQSRNNATSPAVITGLTNDTTYYFTVLGKLALGTSVRPQDVSATPTLPAPAISSAVASDGQVDVSWAASANATGYRAYWSTSSFTSTVGLTPVSLVAPDTSLQLSGLANGTTYYFRVTAIGGSVTPELESELSSEVSATPLFAAPFLQDASDGVGQATATWTPRQGATNYKIFYANTAGVTTSSTSVQAGLSPHDVTGLTKGIVWYFRVAETDASGNLISELSNEDSAASYFEAPTVQVTPGVGQIEVSWNQIPDASNYLVFWDTTPNYFIFPANSNAVMTTTHTIPSLTPGTTYYIWVCVADATPFPVGVFSTVASALSLFEAPTVQATAGNASVALTWNAITGATHYNVYQGTTASFSIISLTPTTVATNSHTATGLTNGTTYYYKVAAADSSSNPLGELSNEVSETPLLPSGFGSISTTSQPVAREAHTSVWTGTEMIVWGGNDDFLQELNTGGHYNPSTDTWAATTTTGAPSARTYHSAVYGNGNMLVWGGQSGINFLNSGGVYNVTSKTWTAISTTNAPTARNGHTAVWTGSKMIVWGGLDDTFFPVNSGGVYDPGTNTWTATSTANAPTGRGRHTAVWTGTRMIVWGGLDDTNFPLGDGYSYDPSTDSWTAISGSNAPAPRDSHTAVWTGSKMIIWGGTDAAFLNVNSGGVYDPATDSWTSTTTSAAPDARWGHTAVWTGSSMMIWGGSDGNSSLQSGGTYDLAGDSWTATPTTNAPSGRVYHTATWTGTKVLIWGGGAGPLGLATSGATYTP